MKINLDLSRHCLETECKKIYELLIGRYFGNKAERAELEPALEALGKFLEKTDFTALRHQYPRLSGGLDREAVVFLRENRRVVIKLNGKKGSGLIINDLILADKITHKSHTGFIAAYNLSIIED